MIRIVDERGTGKTRKLMLAAKENDGILVCMYPDRMQEKAFAYGITGLNIISYHDFENGDYGKLLTDSLSYGHYDIDKKCYIDELEIFIKWIFMTRNIDGYSFTIGD